MLHEFRNHAAFFGVIYVDVTPQYPDAIYSLVHFYGKVFCRRTDKILCQVPKDKQRAFPRLNYLVPVFTGFNLNRIGVIRDSFFGVLLDLHRAAELPSKNIRVIHAYEDCDGKGIFDIRRPYLVLTSAYPLQAIIGPYPNLIQAHEPAGAVKG